MTTQTKKILLHVVIFVVLILNVKRLSAQWSIDTFKTTTTWIVPGNPAPAEFVLGHYTYVAVQAWGGGGGGSAGKIDTINIGYTILEVIAGAGGGGGGSGQGVSALTPGTTDSIKVGIGGAGGIAFSDFAGGENGTSSLAVSGGSAGGGAGGGCYGSGCPGEHQGGQGSDGEASSGNNGGNETGGGGGGGAGLSGNGNEASGQIGGTGGNGGGGNGGNGGINGSNGINGTNYGGGGGGGGADATVLGSSEYVGNGGAGANGLVIITYLTQPIISGNTIICSGQSTTLSVANYFSNCQYYWTNLSGPQDLGTGQSISISSPESYTVTVYSSNFETTSSTVTLTTSQSPSTPTIIVSGDTTFCQGNSVTLTSSTGSYYLWNDSAETKSITVSTSGKYYVTVFNSSGCSASSKPLTVTVNPNPTVLISPEAPTICSDSSLILTSSGANTYTWSPSTNLNSTTGSTVTASPTATTTYIVIGENSSGCSSTDTVTVTVNPSPTLSVSQDTSIDLGDSVQLTASSNSSVTWSPSTGLSCTNCSNPVADPSTTITYTATSTEGACEVSDTVTITVITTGINQLSVNNKNLSIYPNPSPGQFTIQLNYNLNDYTVEVYNVMGEIIYQSVLTNTNNTINLSSQPAGVYFIYLKSVKDIIVGKVLITK